QTKGISAPVIIVAHARTRSILGSDSSTLLWFIGASLAIVAAIIKITNLLDV
ncbi:hypothetical protein LCGC14_3066150, partial [marine sediment metagenome]